MVVPQAVIIIICVKLRLPEPVSEASLADELVVSGVNKIIVVSAVLLNTDMNNLYKWPRVAIQLTSFHTQGMLHKQAGPNCTHFHHSG